MTAKSSLFACQACGDTFPKWHGRCPSCSEWHTLHAAPFQSELGQTGSNHFDTATLKDLSGQEVERLPTTFAELDRVLGGGVVPGSVVLIGGEPGIGKSTLMLQMACAMVNRGRKVLYFSGEESLAQLKMRADRCGLSVSALAVSNGTSLAYVQSAMDAHHPEVIVIDSIQVMTSDQSVGIAGSMAQVRQVSAELIALAKSKRTAVFLVGHITKEGQIAGPKLLEHAVDTVLYFEHAGSDHIRLLRSHKNRFGPTFEVGIFEMCGSGLSDVVDASSVFMHPYIGERVGSVFYPSLQGSRPLILEVQALTTPCQFGAPRRQGMGVEPGRVALLAAVLEKNLGVRFSTQDIFVNIVGGIAERDPALDLAVCLCLLSTVLKRTVPKDIVICGECGLSGEVRRVSHLSRRIKEAAALKLTPIVIPNLQKSEASIASASTHFVQHVRELLPLLEKEKKQYSTVVPRDRDARADPRGDNSDIL